MNKKWRMILVVGVALGISINAHSMNTEYSEAKKEIDKYTSNKEAYINNFEKKFAEDKKIPDESRGHKKYKESIADLVIIKIDAARITVSKKTRSEEEYKKDLKVSQELFQMGTDIIVEKHGPKRL